MKTFKAKVSWPLFGFVGLLLVFFFFLALADRVWFVGAVLAGALLLLGSVLFNTHYIVVGGELVIRCGFFPAQRVPIGQINRVAATRNPLSAPAPSFDRLEIRYDGRRCVLVSPADKAAFVQALLEVNQTIEVRLREGQQPA